MCGILGGINTDFTPESVRRLEHRGPDQQSFDTIEISEQMLVTLGQTRLNIVDRTDIVLPVRIGRAAIVFNGEIYNHPELRSELRMLGWTFQTKTDTEVALAAYLQWGPGCLDKFNGMFAMAIWDGQKFFCARDRMGQKPLFCRVRENRFEFASEIKAFNDLQLVGEDLFDLFEFAFNEYTIFQDIFSLRPGSYLVYDTLDATWFTRNWWDISHRASDRITSEKQAVQQFIELLEDSVKLRMRADVEVTALLSGGLDSSLIANLAGIDDSFTCQFEEFRGMIDEEEYVRDLAASLGIRPTFVYPTKDEFLEDLPSLGYYLEMPTGSFSVFPLYRLAKAVHDAGYKVVLSGEGSDELFAGYARNGFLCESSTALSKDERHQHYASMLGRFEGDDFDKFCRMASRTGLNGAALMKMFLMPMWSRQRTSLENISYIESRIFLQPLLQMSDRMCMAHSVEARCPFLDYRLIEFAFSLDDSLKYRDGTGKWIVHEAAKKLLPRNSLLLNRAVKDGLPAPVNLWMRGKHNFDRKYWNSLLMTECVKSLRTPDAAETASPEVEEQPVVMRTKVRDMVHVLQHPVAVDSCKEGKSETQVVAAE